MSWSEFVTNGFPENVLIGTADPLAMKVVEIARADPDARMIDTLRPQRVVETDVFPSLAANGTKVKKNGK